MTSMETNFGSKTPIATLYCVAFRQEVSLLWEQLVAVRRDYNWEIVLAMVALYVSMLMQLVL